MREIYLSDEQLERFRDHCRENPDSALVRSLTAKGDTALTAGPFSVMDKTMTPPSGDKHDFLRMPTYAWPNPDTPDGLPYILRDGHAGPNRNRDEYDVGRKSNMTNAVKALAGAYLGTGQEKYAEHAVRLLQVWYLDPATRMNPNLTFSKYTPGDEPPYKNGVIATCSWVDMVQTIGMLEDSPAWTKDIESGLKQWFADFLEWLQTSVQGLAEKGAKNNRGVFYDAQLVSFARFSDNDSLARQILEESYPIRLDEQIAPDGSLPHELTRQTSLGYTIMTLKGWALLALMGERLGVDLWNWKADDGRGLRLALDFTGHYVGNPDAWPYPQIKTPGFSGAPFIYGAAAQAYGDDKLLDPLKRLDPEAAATDPATIFFCSTPNKKTPTVTSAIKE